MDIVGEVKKLKLPNDKYVVVGSGILIAYGLKKGTDIDIVVTEDIFNSFIMRGWEQLPWTYPDHDEGIFLRKGLVELYLDVNCGNFTPSTSELIQRAKVIEGVNFASMGDTLKFKKEYVKTKPKHKKDIEIIEQYLKTRNYS